MNYKFYTAKYEMVFESIFYNEENKNLTKDFLSRLLETNIQNIELLKNENEIYNITKGTTILASFNNQKAYINININQPDFLHTKNFLDLSTLYRAKVIKEDEYDLNSKFIHIDLTYQLENNIPIKEEYKIQTQNGKKYIENLTIIEFNMNRIFNYWLNKDTKNIKKYKHLIMLDLSSEELTEIAKNDKFIESFKEKITYLNNEQSFKEAILREENIKISFNSEKKLAYKNGLEKGLEEGIKKGIEQNKKEIILNMLKDGNSIEQIINYVNTTEEEIIKIHQEI